MNPPISHILDLHINPIKNFAPIQRLSWIMELLYELAFSMIDFPKLPTLYVKKTESY